MSPAVANAHELRLETDPAARPGPDGDAIGRARQAMADLATTLDRRFSPAGQTLAQLVETIGAVQAGMEILEGVLGGTDGRDSPAASALVQAARDLREAPRRPVERGEHGASLAAAMERLKGLSADVTRILTILQFYTVNLKIAAAGADEFVEFANDMNIKLAAGRQEVAALDGQIALLLANLAELRAVDAVLLRECARIIPQVPDALDAQVQGLRRQQASLERRTGTARASVARLQGHVGAALGAMQVGDITRQRIEHVHDGCAALEATLAEPGAIDPDGTRGHLLRLLGAQLDDLTQDFADQSGQLQQALAALGPECARLLDPGQRDDPGGNSTDFLRALDESIADAHAMASQLQRANDQAVHTAEVVLAVGGALRERVRSIEDLRFEVDYMAINVNLRARCDAVIGRPVAVIANEIRICSRQLAELIAAVTAVAGAVEDHSAAFEGTLAAQGEPAAGGTLEGAMAVVTRAVEDSDAAMAALYERAHGLARMIAHAQEETAACGALAENLRAMAGGFSALAAGLPAVSSPDGHHPAHALMAGLARSYTMSREREVHDRHVLPGMAGPARTTGPAAVATPGDDDDDALFEDALF